jgi:16S rRNA (guanine527-N7)-methyltransferase
MERLESLAAMLREENALQNLVSRSSLDEFWRRHIADSAQLLAHVPRETTGPWLDLGSGAGFPGLVAAILQADRDVWLVESRSKRIEWLNRATASLGLTRVEVIGKRLERVADRSAAVISARAFAPLDKLLDLSARFSTIATTWLLPKGASAQHELDSLRGWKHMFHVEQSLTDPQAGIIVGHLRGRKARTS